MEKKTHNNAPSVDLHNMRAVTFVLSDEMVDMSITGLQWFIVIPRLNYMGAHRSSDSNSKPYLHRGKKYKIWNNNHQPAAIL